MTVLTTPDPLPRLLAPLRDHPEQSAIVTDFDGTMSPIVLDPEQARPLHGVIEALHRLADRYARVAVVSGRPASFLMTHVGADERLRLFGLYGLEWVDDGDVRCHPDAVAWVDVVEKVAAVAEAEVPEGVWVERKGLSVTLHVRNAPEHVDWIASWADAQAAVTGLAQHPGRMSRELRPPLDIDKGTVVTGLVEDMRAACFIGDDVGDLTAFDALDRLCADGGAALKVGVRSAESPPELLARADLLVDGPQGALELLQML